MNAIEQLACWVFNCTRTQLCLRDYEADEAKMELFSKSLVSYKQGVPIQYITGETEFMGLKLRVNPSVLIPRPETEILVEKVLELMKEDGFITPHILDLGTGSGAIAVGLTKYNPLCKIIASDVSVEALTLAQSNAYLNGVANKIQFMIADIFNGIREDIKFDLIVSNPPYVPSESYALLPVCVRHEPRLALDGGPEGLNFYKRIVPESARRLNTGGYLALEVGDGQADAVYAIIDRVGAYDRIRFLQDYSGTDRILLARRTEDMIDG